MTTLKFGYPLSQTLHAYRYVPDDLAKWILPCRSQTYLGEVASLGAATVRLLSSVFDRSASIKNIGGVVAEALLGVLFLLSWGWSA